jgi:hypothetical protein
MSQSNPKGAENTVSMRPSMGRTPAETTKAENQSAGGRHAEGAGAGERVNRNQGNQISTSNRGGR